MSENSDLWRVDVAGYPVMVRGQDAREHLENVDRQLARMKLVLNKIKLDLDFALSKIQNLGAMR